MENKDFLATEPVGKLLRQLALPTVIAQLINMLYNIVDRMFIGHIPQTGALALTGVGVCMPLIMIVTAFASLVGNGGAPRASIYMGQGNNDYAEKILGNCFITQIIVSIVLTLILFFGNRTFLLAFGASSNTITYLCNGNTICTINIGNEYVYYSPGICEKRNDFSCHWRIM